MCIGENFYRKTQLKNIRSELDQLRRIRTSDIKYRIQLLKKMNDLLKMQNEILLMRQQLLAKGTNMTALRTLRVVT